MVADAVRPGQSMSDCTRASRQIVRSRRTIGRSTNSRVSWTNWTNTSTGRWTATSARHWRRMKRGAVSQWSELLRIMQNGKCFYDETHDITSSEVDHVLPWSFVLEDRTWNLVLACR